MEFGKVNDLYYFCRWETAVSEMAVSQQMDSV